MNRTKTLIIMVMTALLLIACTGSGESEMPTITEEAPDVLTASGFLEAEEVSVVSEVSGRVVEVLADEADTVKAGEPLVRLDDSLLQAELAQAKAAVAVADADLQRMKAGATKEELAAAEAALKQAEEAVKAAQRTSGAAWGAASNPQYIDVQISQAEMELDAAEKQLELLQVELEKAQMRLGWLNDEKEKDNTKIEFEEYNVEIIKANIRAAEARIEGVKKKIELLKEQRTRPVGDIARARSAQAQIAIYEAQVDIAQAQYDLLKNGARPQEIAITEAQVRLATSRVAFIEAQIDQLTLVAPIDGTVTTRAIHVGETANAGTPLLTIANLTELKLVVYVPQTDIDEVQLEMTVNLEIDSLPGETYEGTITFIAQEHEFTPRNVQTREDRVDLVFAVEISIDNEDGDLKPGMPADVIIGNE